MVLSFKLHGLSVIIYSMVWTLAQFIRAGKNEIQVTKTRRSGLDWAKVDPNPTRKFGSYDMSSLK